MTMCTTYQVIQELEHHQSDVKALLLLDGGTRLACASRDGSISLWAKSHHDETPSFALEAGLQGHDAYVNSLAHISLDQGESCGWLASGGNSTMILLHSLDTAQGEPVACLIGHTHNVCALHFSPSRKLLASASWDGTARVWNREGDDWVCQLVLEGHQQAVWDIKVAEDDSWQGPYITASADGGIWLWSLEGEVVQRLKCCPEPVRSIALLSTGEMASGSNDSVIRVWSREGKVIASLVGHQDYIYQVASAANGMVSCGEDQTSRVWNESGALTGTLRHPCTSVWSVAATLDGLVITAGSDGLIRIWKQSSPDVDNEVSGEKDPSETTLGETFDGHVGHSVNQVVIDIDTADDQPPLQLVVRVQDDPAVVARQFGQVHSLSENYIRRIEEFVRAAMPRLAAPKDAE